MTTGNDLLMSGSGTPWCKFPTIGTTCRGKVLAEPIAQQQRDFEDSTKLLTWDNGDPKMEVVVNLQTEIRNFADNTERADAGDEDDGIRALHIASPNMLSAVRQACKTAKVAGLKPGGTLSVTYTEDGEPKGRSRKAPKMYVAAYDPPTSSGNEFFATAADTAPKMDLVEAPPRPAQVPADKWAAMSGEQRRSVAAAVKAMSESGLSAEQPAF